MLLDDVFSGMDGSTSTEVSERLIGPAGLLRTLGSTVVLVTSNRKIPGHLPLSMLTSCSCRYLHMLRRRRAAGR